jgi:hypothetical protein
LLPQFGVAVIRWIQSPRLRKTVTPLYVSAHIFLFLSVFILAKETGLLPDNAVTNAKPLDNVFFTHTSFVNL